MKRNILCRIKMKCQYTLPYISYYERLKRSCPTYLSISAILILFTGLSGCAKFVDVKPPDTQLVTATVYSSDETAGAAISGLYESMVSGTIGGGINGLSLLLGLSADEFKLYPNLNDILNQTYTNTLNASNTPEVWNNLYSCIYQCNVAIEGLSASVGVSGSLKTILTADAKFARALCYFYLVNVYGDVPLITGTDYKINSIAARTSSEDVYKQIVDDLTNAIASLPDNYHTFNGSPTNARTLPNKGAATALMSRVYLYRQDWINAVSSSTSLINNAEYQLSVDVNSVFLADNQEAILQLEPRNNGFNAPDGQFAYGVTLGELYWSYYPTLLDEQFVNAFDTRDLRRQNWIIAVQSGNATYYFPYKYKLFYTGAPPLEYSTVLRLSEQYLIRAEAQAHLEDIQKGLADLNIIRHRAGLEDTILNNKSALLNAIYRERRLELFTEYGHRWFDLKRTGEIDSVMQKASILKGGTWDSNVDKLYPIPLQDMLANKNLVQNPGYK